jgi:hypothetical protein
MDIVENDNDIIMSLEHLAKSLQNDESIESCIFTETPNNENTITENNITNDTITQLQHQESSHISFSLEENNLLSPDNNTDNNSFIPKIVFIVPYRNRETQLQSFKTHMKHILEDYHQNDYVIYYIHQTDQRVFNRGAMKNIGFLVVKNNYPNDYKNITLVFNDVDTMPTRKNLFNYDTQPGVVKHFFGFTYTLGGIFSIKAYDFERINGFPNYWAWGYEDNLIQKRIEKAGITIDRSIFYKIGDTNIIQKNEEITREVNQSEYDRYVRNIPEGIYSIQNLDYSIDHESGFVNVKWFITEYNPAVNKYRLHDLREGPIPYDTKFGLMYNNRRVRGGRMRMSV